MKTIKVLGSGCAKCDTTYRLIADVAKSRGTELNLLKVEDMASILAYGVLSTPGVVIDDKVVHMGSVPSKGAVENWLVD